MPQQIVSRSTSPQISQADRWALNDAHNSMVGPDCTRPPAPAVRDRLSRFLAQTESFLLPALDSEIDDEISLLMVSFRSARTISATEAEATVVAYMDALRGLPRWAIANGLRKVRLGEVAGVSRDFPPAAARLRKVVTDEMVPLRADRIAIQRVLAAREAPEANTTAAARASDAAKSALNPMQQKYGPSYGLGHIERAAELPAGTNSDETFKALQGDALVKYYRHHGLGRTLKQESAPAPVSENAPADGYEEMIR